MKKNLCFAIGQFNFVVGDIAGNTARILAAAQEAQRKHAARLIVFPELAMTAYPPEDWLFHKHFLEQVQAQQARLCEASRDIAIIVGSPQQRNGRLYNSALYFDQGHLQAVYDKIALPNYSVFDEKRYFAAGEHPCVVELEGLRLGIVICEDLWDTAVVEEIQANAKQQQTKMDLLVHINASPFYLGKNTQRLNRLRVCAQQLQTPVLYVNQVGGQDELVFDGASCLMDATGRLVLETEPFQEGIYSFQLTQDRVLNDPVLLRPTSPNSQVQLSDESLLWKALCLGLGDYVQKNHFAGVVIGLSGGVDSAVTLALAVDALGAERVRAVMMPSRYTAAMSIEDAQAMASNFGVELIDLPIEPAFERMLEQLQPVFGAQETDTTEENIQARIRGVFLMALSNKFNWAVLATSNKSEVALGYSTLYGDMVGAFAPLKDLTKTWVYRLARHCNSLFEKIPQRVLTRPPSAELAPDQCDQDSLPPYEQIDPILEYFMDHRLQGQDAGQFDAQVFAQVINRVLQYEYKRRQAPLGIKVTRNAFGKDWRYPVSSGYKAV